MPPKAIPDRWIPYKACGDVIEGTRFICFKVPLRRSVQINVREIEKIWDIPTVLGDIPKLGAVIDLTNTARYYNPQDFLKANVLHRKILMPGRIIPPESSVKEFKQAVDEFFGKDADSLVGVHCTHGLNRTGYMVCRYMRDVLRIPALETIQRFEKARGYQIERDIYRNDIMGLKSKPVNLGKETELVPVVSRRHDLNYRSPLGDEYVEESRESSNRFGNNRFNDRYGNSRTDNDRFGYNRFHGSGNASVPSSSSGKKNSGSNGLFSCYTDRYSNGRTHSRTGENDSAGSTSWRDRNKSSGRNSHKHVDSGYNKNKREDRVGLVMPDFQRVNEQPK